MFISALSVEGIGRFAGAARVAGFGTGVNVLAAGNEVGKSTLFKAIRTCLFYRHDSKAQEIKDLGSDESQLPDGPARFRTWRQAIRDQEELSPLPVGCLDGKRPRDRALRRSR
jgi:hypothetical protein